MQSRSAHELEPLLAHAGFVRRLASRLADDAHDADDLTQETWLALLRGRSRPRGSPRSFLAGVLRRRALQRARSEGRRREREARAEGPDVAPSAAEALERAELGRELAELVIELEEPFRSAVLLRHVSDLPPRAIAERLGVPPKTVESRLARGHARLRERWRQRCAERGERPDAWLASLALVAERPPPAALAPTTPPILGALIVNAKLVLLTLAVAGGGGLLWLAVGTRSEPSALDARPSPERLAAAPRPLEEPARDTLPTPPPVEREAPPAAVAADSEPEAAATEPVAQLFPLRGRVVDPEVRPLAGIEVAAGTGELARSGANGRFELLAPAGPASVRVTDEGLENLFRVRTAVPSQGEVLLVAAPHRALAGTVRDAAERPIAGARVSLELPEDFRTRFDVPLDAVDLTEWTSTTGADGRFELGRAPLVEGARVEARLEGHATASVPAPSFAQADLELVLVPPDLEEGVLAGRVVDPAGVPVPGALVSLGGRCATAAADGTFRLDRSDAPEATVLRAVQAGRLPAVWQALPDPVTGEPSWPEWIELELGGEPLELAGRVVDQDGELRSEVLVWIEDPTEFGVLETYDGTHVEFLAAPLESTYSSGDSYFRSTRTDEQGRFRIQGLLEREYRLGFLHAETLERATSGPYSAGQDGLELVLPRSEPGPLEVRLLSRSGEPVAGASIGLNTAIFGGVHHPRGSATTDAEGRVRFEDVAGSPLSLWIRGENVVPVIQGISRPEPGEEVVLHVDVLCHFKVDLGDHPELADGVRALDADGEGLILYDIGANGYLSKSVAQLVAGKSVTLGVSDAAAELVLEREGVEVRRIPIDFSPGDLQVVTP